MDSEEVTALREEVEDLSISLFLEDRLARSTGERSSLEDVAEELGLGEGLTRGR